MQTKSVSLSPDKAKTLVRNWWMAFGKFDRDKVLALLDDDIVWEVKFVGHWLPNNGISRGKDVVTKNCIDMFGSMYDIERLVFDDTNIISDGSTVIIEFSIDGYTSVGVRYDKVEYVWIVELLNGKVKHVREYMDALKAKAAHSL